MTLSPATSIASPSAKWTRTLSRGDAHSGSGGRRPCGVDLDQWRQIAADDRSGLGLAVALQQSDPERQKKPADLGVERRPARDHRLEPAAKALPNLGPNDAIEKRIGEPLAEARALREQALATDPHPPGEH